MTDEIEDGASAPGVPFAYDLASAELTAQEAIIREANRRLEIVAGASLTFATIFLKNDPGWAPWLRTPIGVALIIILGFVARSYPPRTYYRQPDPRAITELAQNGPGAMKEAVLGTMLKSIDANREIIRIKNQYYVRALRVGLYGFIIGIAIATITSLVGLIKARANTPAPISRVSCVAKQLRENKSKADISTGKVPQTGRERLQPRT